MTQYRDGDAPRNLAWTEPGRTTLEIHTGGWRTRRPVWRDATAPCRAACPAGEPIAAWIERARAGDLAGAWSLICEENPFPAVTGRVCAHPCERACHRAGVDGAVAINALERWVGDWGLRHGVFEPADRLTSRVAVVGGGPAGLTCAYHLARAGHRVTIIEAEAALGGLLRHGIPGYRLPRAVVEREIERIVALGVTVETGRRLDAAAWTALDAFDAVFVATGAALPQALDVPGADGKRVLDGLAFLRRVNTGETVTLGPRVAVVGGGSTAIDVARTARRLGAAVVTMLALETPDTMPAVPDEVTQALAEGVEIRHGAGVRALRAGKGGVIGVVVAPARLGRGPDGAVTPILEAEGDVLLDVDHVLVAIGQRADLASLPETLDAGGGVLSVTSCGGSSLGHVFAGGDVASRERTVAHAIAAGTRGARAIHRMLAGGRRPGNGVSGPPVPASRIAAHAFPPLRRAVRRERLAAKRTTSFVEVVDGLGDDAARAETVRCFACGHCVRCDTCLAVCPDVAIARKNGHYELSTAHCKGCGLCARECPRGALVMVQER